MDVIKCAIKIYNYRNNLFSNGFYGIYCETFHAYLAVMEVVFSHFSGFYEGLCDCRLQFAVKYVEYSRNTLSD